MRYSDKHGFYELSSLQGCGQVVVSTHAFIHKGKRGKGHGSTQHLDRLRNIRALGYDAALCTVRGNNVVEIHILEKYGWRRVAAFHNSETGNDVYIYFRTMEVTNE